MKNKFVLYVLFGMQKLQHTLIETEKTRKTHQKKRTFDAHQNQYIIGVYENHYKISKNKLQKLYGFLLVIKDSKNGSAAVGLSKKVKEISP